MKERLRLAVLVNLYPPYIVGGNEILARDVVEALRARGHTVHVLTGSGRDLPADGFTHGVMDLDLDRKQDVFLGGLPVTPGRALRWHLYNPRTYRGVRRALAALELDLVVAWNLYGASMAPLVAARGFSWPVVAQPADKWLLHGLADLTAMLPEPARRGYGVRLAQRLLQPLVARRARPDYILAISEFIRRLHLSAGFPASRSRATHLGVPLDLFPARAPRFPDRDPWRLVFAGQLWEGKGPQVAVEAVRLLGERRETPGVALDIFGSGAAAFLEHLDTLVTRGGLAARVRRRGFVTRPELSRELAGGDVFLFCSTWDEPFSGGLLEALCAGLPVIATTAGGTPEAIVDGETGLLVPPGQPAALADALVRLMHNPALYEHLSRRAAAEVRRRWSFDAYIDRLEDAYSAIVAAHRGGRAAVLDAA